jgi:hypothetical protein
MNPAIKEAMERPDFKTRRDTAAGNPAQRSRKPRTQDDAPKPTKTAGLVTSLLMFLQSIGSDLITIVSSKEGRETWPILGIATTIKNNVQQLIENVAHHGRNMVIRHLLNGVEGPPLHQFVSDGLSWDQISRALKIEMTYDNELFHLQYAEREHSDSLQRFDEEEQIESMSWLKQDVLHLRSGDQDEIWYRGDTKGFIYQLYRKVPFWNSSCCVFASHSLSLQEGYRKVLMRYKDPKSRGRLKKRSVCTS